MTRLKHLLIFSLCVGFSYFAPSVSLNAISKNNEEVITDDDNSVKLNQSMEFENGSLNQAVTECDCGENSISCKYGVNEKKICTCKPGFAPKINTSNTSDAVCAECDCGRNAISCHFEFGFKVCTCPDGSVRLDDMCPSSECDCGDYSISCELDRYNRKKCTCKEGFSPVRKTYSMDEECKRCDCGTAAVSCKFDYLQQKICECRRGYAVYTHYGGMLHKVQECKKCDCGVDGISCSFGSGNSRQCTCRDGSYSEYDYSSGGYECKRCNCGLFSVSCKSEYGFKKCSCIEGYHARRSSYSSNEECAKNDERSTITSGWKIATYIVAIIYVALFILLIIILQQKRRNRTS